MKKALQLTAFVGSIVAISYFSITKDLKGFYDNELSRYLTSSKAQDSLFTWHKKNGDNSIAWYGVDGVIGSAANRNYVRDLILKQRRNKIPSAVYIYSSSSIGAFDMYQSTVSDSSKFNEVISEIEPYQDGQYSAFYSAINTYSAYAKSKGLLSSVYMGWPTAACWDSIVRLTDKIYLHCYLPSSRMNGASMYSYCSTRLKVIADCAKRRNKKANVVIIFSCEPAFAYDFFRTNEWNKAFELFKAGWYQSSTAEERTWITLAGRKIFVSQYGRLARP